MELGWRHALAGAAILFIAFLLFKMRPARRRGGALAARQLQAARERVRRAATPQERIEALCEAGALVARGADPSAAAGFFLRAMRADPASADVIGRAIAALERPAPRLLEKMLWRRLSLLPWRGPPRAAARASALGLRHLYGRTIRDRSRAELMRKLAQALEDAGPDRAP
jgi:hypothetical protein